MKNKLTFRGRIFGALRNKRRFFERNEEVKAGREAEYRVRNMINRRIEGTGWAVFSSIRVPDPDNSRRREYDFIITSPTHVFVIELKNWSGRLQLMNSDIIQHRRFEKDPINHGNILDDLEYKAELLQSYYRQHTGYELSTESLLVFYNDNLEIPDEIASNKMVATYKHLREILPISPYISIGIIEAILILLGLKDLNSQEPLSTISKSISDFHSSLLDLGSWDVLEYRGEKISFGDIHYKETGQVKVGNTDITNRMDISSIDVNVDQSVLRALFHDPKYSLQINYRDYTVKNIPFESNLVITFQPAGSKDSIEVFVRNLVRVEYGYRSQKHIENSWESIKEEMIFEGRILNIHEIHGVFVDIGAPVDGLVHSNQIDEQYLATLKTNDMIKVQVKHIDKDRKRISLVIPITD